MDMFYPTNKGLEYAALTAMGKSLVFTKGKFGNGVRTNESIASMTELIKPLGELPIVKKIIKGNTILISTEFTNEVKGILLDTFYLSEVGLFAKLQNEDGTDDIDNPEVLVGYAFDSPGDKISGGVLTEFVINFPMTVAASENIVVEISSIAYALQKDLEETYLKLNEHTEDTNNPHNVTKSQVGLGNVPNVATNDQTPTFTEASTRSNINSGEPMKIILGKIKKWFSDMKAVAFTGSYSDLSDTPTTLPNPNELTLSVNGSESMYDGSKPISKTLYAPTTKGQKGYEAIYNGSNSFEWRPASVITAVCESRNGFHFEIPVNYVAKKEGVIAVIKFTFANRISDSNSYCFMFDDYMRGVNGIVTLSTDYWEAGDTVIFMYSESDSTWHIITVLKQGKRIEALLGGLENRVTANNCAVVGGSYNTALTGQLKTGHFSKEGTAGGYVGTNGDSFIIGNGTSDTERSNAFRIAYDGSVYGMRAYNSTGADYAEYMEWFDGNKESADRRGLFVTLDGDKICIANEGDYILGVISANPSVIGNNFDDDWQGKYLTDVFGQTLTEEVEVPEKTDENGKIIIPAHTVEHFVLNPDYKYNEEYIPRAKRNEWDLVGMLGQIVVVDDGSCMENGFCKCGVKGVATKADIGYRVLKRLDDTHIKILFK